MKSVFLYAYTKINLGDDLFIQNILSRYSDYTFYLSSSEDYKRVFKEYDNIKVIDENKGWLKLLKKIWPSGVVRYLNHLKNKSKACVYIGGSIFMEYSSWKDIVNWWNYQAENYDFFVVGANFGPFKTCEYKNEMNKVFLKMNDICFRDQYSYSLFENNSKVRYAPDLLFTTNIPSINTESKKIFISLINCDSKDEGINSLKNLNVSYCENIAKVALKYISKGYQLVFSSFCKDEGDLISIYKVIELMNITDDIKQNIKILSYKGTNRNEILVEIASSAFIIGSRFHAIVLGMTARKPVFPIVYSNKTLNLLSDLKFKGNYICIEDINKINFEFVNKNFEDNYILNIDDISADAEKHYAVLDQVLNKD